MVDDDAVPKNGSVLDQLLKGTDLPNFAYSPDFDVLGMKPVDFLCTNVLAAAGINVELVGRASAVEGMEDESPLYHAVQIVSNVDIEMMTVKTQLNDVNWVDKRDMLGLQVKLSGAHKWKVTIDSESREQHVGGGTTRGRGRGADRSGDKKHVYFNHNIYEVAVPVEFGAAPAMMCTAALARGITINIAFKTHEEDGSEFSSWHKTNNLPLILQRRIDMMFTNRFFTDVQVWFRSRTHDQNRTRTRPDGLAVGARRRCGTRTAPMRSPTKGAARAELSSGTITWTRSTVSSAPVPTG